MKGADAALPRRTLENMQRILTTRGRLLATASPRLQLPPSEWERALRLLSPARYSEKSFDLRL